MRHFALWVFVNALDENYVKNEWKKNRRNMHKFLARGWASIYAERSWLLEIKALHVVMYVFEWALQSTIFKYNIMYLIPMVWLLKSNKRKEEKRKEKKSTFFLKFICMHATIVLCFVRFSEILSLSPFLWAFITL